jgi:DNA-binding SARP family transcriptional activator
VVPRKPPLLSAERKNALCPCTWFLLGFGNLGLSALHGSSVHRTIVIEFSAESYGMPSTTARNQGHVGQISFVSPSFSLTSLGCLQIHIGGKLREPPRTANARALLAYLVAHAGRDIPRERLIDLFWTGCDVDRARGSLKTALWLIRAAIRAGPDRCDDWLYTNKVIVRCKGAAYFDRDVFLKAASASDADSLRFALRLYAGDFLEGHSGEWVEAERARIANIYESVIVKLLRVAPDGRLAEKLLERNPYHEEAYRVLIEERLAEGSVHSAARLVAQCSAALAEVGARPSETLLGRIPPHRR